MGLPQRHGTSRSAERKLWQATHSVPVGRQFLTMNGSGIHLHANKAAGTPQCAARATYDVADCKWSRPTHSDAPLFSNPVEPFSPSDSLGIVRVLDLYPRERIRAGLGLADNSFQVLLTHQLEETRSAAVQVAHVQQARMVCRHQFVQQAFALNQRLLAQVAAIEPHEVEGAVARFSLTHHQVCEY